MPAATTPRSDLDLDAVPEPRPDELELGCAICTKPIPVRQACVFWPRCMRSGGGEIITGSAVAHVRCVAFAIEVGFPVNVRAVRS